MLNRVIFSLATLWTSQMSKNILFWAFLEHWNESRTPDECPVSIDTAELEPWETGSMYMNLAIM